MTLTRAAELKHLVSVLMDKYEDIPYDSVSDYPLLADHAVAYKILRTWSNGLPKEEFVEALRNSKIPDNWNFGAGVALWAAEETLAHPNDVPWGTSEKALRHLMGKLLNDDDGLHFSDQIAGMIKLYELSNDRGNIYFVLNGMEGEAFSHPTLQPLIVDCIANALNAIPNTTKKNVNRAQEICSDIGNEGLAVVSSQLRERCPQWGLLFDVNDLDILLDQPDLSWNDCQKAVERVDPKHIQEHLGSNLTEAFFKNTELAAQWVKYARAHWDEAGQMFVGECAGRVLINSVLRTNGQEHLPLMRELARLPKDHALQRMMDSMLYTFPTLRSSEFRKLADAFKIFLADEELGTALGKISLRKVIVGKFFSNAEDCSMECDTDDLFADQELLKRYESPGARALFKQIAALGVYHDTIKGLVYALGGRRPEGPLRLAKDAKIDTHLECDFSECFARWETLEVKNSLQTALGKQDVSTLKKRKM